MYGILIVLILLLMIVQLCKLMYESTSTINLLSIIIDQYALQAHYYVLELCNELLNLDVVHQISCPSSTIHYIIDQYVVDEKACHFFHIPISFLISSTMHLCYSVVHICESQCN